MAYKRITNKVDAIKAIRLAAITGQSLVEEKALVEAIMALGVSRFLDASKTLLDSNAR